MGEIPARASWVTYVRCHDDIGWAVTDEDAASVGWGGAAHRAFLNEFYRGAFPSSFARGALFQHNEATGDARISGSAASLCGVESALEHDDPTALDLAVSRLELLYAVVFSYGGVPLVYMGDELGLLNDHTWEADPARRDDNRWMHRPRMDWEAAGRRHAPDTVEGRIWAGLTQLAAKRRSTRAVHAQGTSEPLWTGNDHVFALRREHAGERMLLLANFSAAGQTVPAGIVAEALTLEPYGFRWIV